jgi:alanyl-tRNA synthetase
LRQVLGKHVAQKGSLVSPALLRFDFAHFAKMTDEETRQVEELVNEKVRANIPVVIREMPKDEALKSGATALFGEKYGDTVRVVTIDPDYSVELCGGTHVGSTGMIGLFVISSEAAAAAGVRRIEALTGTAAVDRMLGQQRLVEGLGRDLRVTWTEVPAQVKGLQDRTRQLEREIERLQGDVASAQTGDLLANVREIDGIKVLAARVEVSEKGGLRQLGDRLRDKLQSGVIVIGTVVDDKPSLLAVVTPDLTAQGLKAGDIIRTLASHIDGRGGGRPELAEAGGKNPDGLPAALAAVESTIHELASKVSS